ncbi:fimbrial protein [Cupriavidus necator]|uniref:fimbrial protein n=1 Tax=Cupriavidus necator TaxID=106590 RepID=UPI0039C3AEAB
MVLRHFRKSLIRLLNAAALVALLAMYGQSFGAAFSCTPNLGVLSFSLPTGNFGVPRDTPVGTRITPFTGRQLGYPSVWTCSVQALTYIGPAYQSLLPSAGITYSENGVTYPVFQTNVAGVGVIIGANSNLWTMGWFGGGREFGFATGWITAGLWSNSAPATGVFFGPSVDIAFVKTGPIAGGTVTLPGTIGQAGMSLDPPVSVQAAVPIVVSGNPVFNELACRTPDVTVDLGTHQRSEFSGIGSTAAPKSFSISVNNCPSGISTARYRLDAVTTILNASNAVVALDGSSTAAGVGVQILDDAGNVHPLGTLRAVPGYNPAGGNFTVPLKARYYQTGNPITPGLANTALTFTMDYQ